MESRWNTNAEELNEETRVEIDGGGKRQMEVEFTRIIKQESAKRSK